jgi:hypothetical protein
MKHARSIQYASQLFLSYQCPSKVNPLSILKPSASTLILSGNCFRQGSHYNKLWFDYISQCWENICIIPGLLEYSWLGLDKEVDINTSEIKLKEEISKYSNIHYLSMNSVEINNMQISGLTKWPLTINNLEDDIASGYIGPSNMIKPDYWKLEEDEWLNDIIQQYSYHNKPHIIVSYFSPIPSMLNKKYLSEINKDLPFCSLYPQFFIKKIPVSTWIIGVPNTNITGYCPYGKTFMGCNSRGLLKSPGYYEGMVMYVQSDLI